MKSTTRRILLVWSFLILGFDIVFGQTVTLSGTVKDNSGLPLPGVAVAVKGTTLGVATQNDGSYSLQLATADKNTVLVFSFLGFKKQEVKYSGKNVINVTLREEAKELDDVVVTALGIRREEKGLGYATQTVTEQMMSDATPNNWASALVGKVAGANILNTGSGPLGSSRITLRGDASLNADGNNALIVVDGVPMNSGMTGSGANSYGAGSGSDVPIDYGNGIADINPDDIASIQVLKGATAAALYGSRAANGVLLITTKSGSKRNKKYIGITINSNSSMDAVLKWPDWQYEYGQGNLNTNKDGNLYYSYGLTEDGAGTSGTSSAFGPKFEGQMYYQYDPETYAAGTERTLWRPYKDNRKDFWRIGYTLTNSIAIDGGNDKGSMRLSLTHTKNEWIMPNTGFERLTVSGSAQQQLTDKLRANMKVSYTRRTSDNLPATGYNNQSMSYFMIFQNPNVDLNWLRPIWKEGQEQTGQIRPFSSYIDNPYLIAYECLNPTEKNGVVAVASVTYEFSPKFMLMIRSGIDFSNDNRETIRPYGMANFPAGYYKQQNVFNFENNTDFLFTYRDQLSNRFNLSVSAGANRMDNKYRMYQGYVKDLITPGVYKLSNGVTSPIMNTVYRNKRVNSIYAAATLSFDNKIFLDVTGRNDWSSTLPEQNNSFFYPSVSTSFVLNELLSLPKIISFAKLRASWAQVGNDTDPYKTAKYYGVSEFPGSASVPTTLHNVDFKPEIQESFEIGLDYRMFKNRLGIDVAFYNNVTRNQILDVPLDPTTGYSKATMNAGKVRNRGIELEINGKPVQTGNFNWNFNFTWAKNYNRIMALSEGMDESQIIAQSGTVSILAKVGGSTGDIYGYKLKRAPDGQVIFTEDGKTASPSEIEYVGSAYAKWKAGFYNEFTYKNIRLSVLLDGQWKGIVYSQAHHKMSEQGKLKHTLRFRENPNFEVVGEGVQELADGSYKKNDVAIPVNEYYKDYYRRANVETNSFDASFLKIREARLEYNFSRNFLEKIGFEKVSIAVWGRNLTMWTKFPLFDPEVGALNSGTIVPGVEMGQLPSTRTMGINLTLKF